MKRNSFEQWQPWLEHSANKLLAGAVVEIKDGTGKRRLGTGTVISNDGSVLTCHHIIDTLEHVTLVHHTSGRKEVVRVLQSDVSVNFDLALLRTSWTDIPPLSLALLADKGDWNAHGYQDEILGYTDVVPLEGHYVRAGARAYSVGCGYKIAETFDLLGSAIHGGTSGAALLDRTSGCIIGVISASLTNDCTATHTRATAIALRAPAAAWPPFASLSRQLEETVPRFGESLNSLGIKLLSGVQRHATIEDLVAAGVIDRQRLVARAGLVDALTGFLASDRVVMPIIGPSGTGKTSIAALIADKMNQPHVLLLRGVNMQTTDADISLQIERALRDTDQGTYGLNDILSPDLPRPSAKIMAACAAGTGKPLLIVLDALNERDGVAIPAHRLAQQWFPRTIQWLQNNKARLIVTCRSETWRLLLPINVDQSIFPPRRDDPEWRRPPGLSRAPDGGFWIEDLTDTEVIEMAKVYGLQETRVEPQIIRHPFAMRLAAETSNWRKDDEPPITEIDLLERAVASRITAVAQRTGASTTSEAQVKTFVQAIAIAMLIHGTDRLSGTIAAGLPLANSVLLQALADEGVLESVGQDYRFRFDQYADMERSRALVLPLKIDLSAVAAHLAQPSMWSSIKFAADRMMKEEAARARGNNRMAAILLKNRVVETPGNVELRLGLLLEVMHRRLDGFGVRGKDWHDISRYGSNLEGWLRDTEIDKQLRTLHAEDGPALLRTLVLRLGDDRRFSSEGSISSLCGGCICALNDPRLEVHYAELFNHRSWLAGYVLDVTLRQRHDQLVGWMLRALSVSEKSSDLTREGKLRIIRLLQGSSGSISEDQRRQALVAVQLQLLDRDHNVRAAAASATLGFDPSNAAAYEYLFKALQPDRTDQEFHVALQELPTIPPERVGDVLHLIFGRLHRSADQWQVSSYGFGWYAVQCLCTAQFDPFSETIADFLLQHAGEDKEADRAIVEWGISVISRLDPDGQVFVRVIALINHIAGSGNDRIHIPLVEAAYYELREKCPDACKAIRNIVEQHGLNDSATKDMLLYCIRNWESASERVAMASIHRHRNPDKWDNIVEDELSNSPDDDGRAFAAAVVDYWRSLPRTELTTTSKKILDHGEPWPKDALD